MVKLLHLLKTNVCYITRVSFPLSSAPALVQSKSFNTSKTMFKSAVFNLQEGTKDQVQEFLNSFDTVLTDCDGKKYLFWLCSLKRVFKFFNDMEREVYKFEVINFQNGNLSHEK